MADYSEAIAAFEKMTKAEILAELQKLGVSVNPQANKESLMTQLKEEIQKPENSIVLSKDPSEMDEAELEKEMKAAERSYEVPPAPTSDMQKIMDAISGLATQVQNVTNDVARIKDGGRNAFKENPNDKDVLTAEEQRSQVDPKIARIVEETLGVDFGVTVTGFTDKPGLVCNIHVPQRLSPVQMSKRPKASVLGGYEKDPVSGLDVLEDYWPGDTRSVAVGSTQSYDVVQAHCNRVRAYILAYYQKLNRPQPEFRLK